MAEKKGWPRQPGDTIDSKVQKYKVHVIVWQHSKSAGREPCEEGDGGMKEELPA